MSNPPLVPPTKIKVLSGRVVHEPELSSKTIKLKTRHPQETKADNQNNPSQPTMSSTATAEDVQPIYVDSSRELDEIFRDMHPYFEGKESEQNWSWREKSVQKLRRITKGNAPEDFTGGYLAGIKSLLDGILKTVNSLRTTLSANGCLLVQDIAKTAGSGIDNMVEILLQNLIKLCANTKKIAAANGNTTVNAIVANVTYNVRIAQHMWAACQDKNVQPRSYATGWLKTIITKYRHHKHSLEHGGSLDLIEKCIKAGLSDRDPKVRENMRPTYWAFARLWPEKSEVILSSLDVKQQKLLIEDASNPKPHKYPEQSAVVTDTAVHPFSKSAISVPPRPTIRETIAAQKRAKTAGKNLPERPGSAEPSATPIKTSSISNITRPATAMSTIGSLSSAPMRPMRPARRPEVKRPGTADPHTNRKPIKLSPTKSDEVVKSPSLYKKSPQTSPLKKTNTPSIRRTDALSNKHNDLLPIKKKEVSPKPIEAASHVPNMPQMSSQIPLRMSAYSQNAFPSNFTAPLNNVGLSSNLDSQQEEGVPVKKERLSLTPRAIASRKENLSSRLKVYEDPVGGLDATATPQTGTPPTASRTKVLEELPINEPALYQPRLSPNFPLLAEETETPLYHQKWINVEAAARRVSDSDKTDNPYFMRRILEGGIARVKAGTLDVHGFRKLQGLIRSREDIWEEGVKFDELLLLLLENLESPSGPSQASVRPQDVKTQVLMTIRLMQQHQPKYFSAYYPRALCAIILARKHYHSTSHIVCGLEETSETIVSECEPLPCIEAILELLEMEPRDQSDTVFMGLYVLAGLLHRISSLRSSEPDTPSNQLTSAEQNIRLGHIAAKCLMDTNPDVRRAVVEFALELHDVVGDKASFWALVGGLGEDHRSLITYYLARREKVYSRVERGNGSGLMTI